GDVEEVLRLEIVPEIGQAGDRFIRAATDEAAPGDRGAHRAARGAGERDEVEAVAELRAEEAAQDARGKRRVAAATLTGDRDLRPGHRKSFPGAAMPRGPLPPVFAGFSLYYFSAHTPGNLVCRRVDPVARSPAPLPERSLHRRFPAVSCAGVQGVKAM